MGDVKEAVAKALPAGNGFDILAERTRLGTSHVLRVITPAWKNLPKMDRILKMQDAILPVLSEREKNKIFRISVLTPAEWKELRDDRSFRRKFTVLVHKNGSRSRRKLPAKASPSRRRMKPATS